MKSNRPVFRSLVKIGLDFFGEALEVLLEERGVFDGCLHASLQVRVLYTFVENDSVVMRTHSEISNGDFVASQPFAPIAELSLVKLAQSCECAHSLLDLLFAALVSLESYKERILPCVVQGVDCPVDIERLERVTSRIVT